MALNSRQKGARGEREWAEFMRERGFEARRGVQFSGSPDSPDVVHSIPGWACEVKRVEKLNIREAMDQAWKDSGNKKPFVAHRTNRQNWLVTMTAADFLELVKGIGE